ncbi:MAG: hypothetical protein IKB92_07640 [Clostridia bacterium]|nr:hypothetical protein [Clostridia bacterium]
MAKFCKNCGKMLEDGAVCDCTQVAPATPEAPAAPTAEPAPVYVAPEAPATPAAPAAPKNGIGTYFKKIWDLFVALVKKPVTTASAFVNSCDHKTALGLIAINAIAVGLLLVSFAGEFNNLIEETAGRLVDVDDKLFPSFKIFFVGAIGTFGIGALLPAVLMMFTKIFKKDTNYKYMLCASGVNSLAVTPFVLAGFLISLLFGIDPDASSSREAISMMMWALYIPLIISTIGNTLGSYITMKSLRAGSSLTEDNTPYVMFFTGLVMGIALAIVIYIAFPMCMPEYFEDASMFDLIGDLID